ncbi:MAG: hypothetical protein HY897_06080 [Deltaproteobacteria bacterium]|nr:hypothetical protein [Deltaproteobacteria bacterium]
MQTYDEILNQIMALPRDERRRLMEAIEDEAADETDADPASGRAAVLDRWLGRAGTGHSDYSDVAGNKYKHLADVYADKK